MEERVLSDLTMDQLLGLRDMLTDITGDRAEAWRSKFDREIELRQDQAKARRKR